MVVCVSMQGAWEEKQRSTAVLGSWKNDTLFGCKKRLEATKFVFENVENENSLRWPIPAVIPLDSMIRDPAKV